MASNKFSLNSSSDYEIEVEGLPKSSDHAEEETQEAYALEQLANAEWPGADSLLYWTTYLPQQNTALLPIFLVYLYHLCVAA